MERRTWNNLCIKIIISYRLESKINLLHTRTIYYVYDGEKLSKYAFNRLDTQQQDT